jgi:glycosyltransferase involved in cell wall biosynthesis
MRVLVISHMFPTDVNPMSGIFVLEQVKALYRLGVDVTVLAPQPHAPWPLSVVNRRWRAIANIPLARDLDGIRVFHPRYLAFPRALLFCSSGHRLAISLLRYFNRRLSNERFDIVHSHVAVPDGYAGMYIARKLQAPHIITVHGQDFHVTAQKSRGCRNALRTALGSADRIITVSSALLNRGAALFPELRNRFVVVPNGITTEKVELARSTPERCSNRPLVVSVSNLVKTKGIDTNLRALASIRDEFPSIRYVIIGDGPERSYLERLVSELGLESHVAFLGRLPNVEALRYVAAADVFSLPSWMEGFGVAHLEAMALAKPVIACRGQGPEDFIQDGINGILISPKDEVQLAETLRRILGDPVLSSRIGERARSTVLHSFTWEAIAARLESLYEEVLSERPSHASIS